MNKREMMLGLVNGATPEYVPAAFFLHFDKAFHEGWEAVDKHLQFFRTTGMDFVKIQYEQGQPSALRISKAEDWANAPRCPEEWFEPTLRVVEGLVKAAKDEAVVIMTLYSPFMWAKNFTTDADLGRHLQENPEAVKAGLEIMTENVLNLARGCKRAGIDGFYASSQGGEAFRFPGTDFFERYIKPTDLRVWEEIGSCPFNILHICDYEGGYDDLAPFLDYPGQVVNCNLNVGNRTMTAKEAGQLFGRPFMGGMERKGVLATGSAEVIRKEAERVLAEVPERFILGADCTVPGETPWENLKTAIDAAHGWRR